MTNRDERLNWRSKSVFDVAGEEVGRVQEVYSSPDLSSLPLVRVEMSSGEHAVVPVMDVVDKLGGLWLPYSRDEIAAAPSVQSYDELTSEKLASILDHFGVKDKARFLGTSGDLPGDPEVPYKGGASGPSTTENR